MSFSRHQGWVGEFNLHKETKRKQKENRLLLANKQAYVIEPSIFFFSSGMEETFYQHSFSLQSTHGWAHIQSDGRPQEDLTSTVLLSSLRDIQPQKIHKTDVKKRMSPSSLYAHCKQHVAAPAIPAGVIAGGTS